MDKQEYGVVIVGAGQAGCDVSLGLRQQGYSSTIRLIGDENYPPYRRPPLSKSFLAGDATLESLYLRPEASYKEQRIECSYGIGVESIDRQARTVRLFDATQLEFDHLVLATGGKVRRLSLRGADRANVHYVRTIDDILRLKDHFLAGKRLVIVGGGFIGLEAAAVGIQKKLNVTVVEALPRVLARVTSPEMSAFYEQAHRSRGVTVLTGTGVHALEGEPLVDTVVLSDGRRIPADVLVVGIGIVPNIELADAAGLAVSNGIVTDSSTKTEDPHIYAIGDCGNHRSSLFDRHVRLESVPNASEQARICAAAICAKPIPPSTVPWFWSDQYDLKLQMAGLCEGYDQVAIRGDPSKESFCALYLRGGTIIAVDAVNRPGDFVVSKRLIAERVAASVERLADDASPLKALLSGVQTGV